MKGDVNKRDIYIRRWMFCRIQFLRIITGGLLIFIGVFVQKVLEDAMGNYSWLIALPSIATGLCYWIHYLYETIRMENKNLIELKKIPLEEAKNKIYRYIKEHPGCLTSDIILNLKLDPNLVLEALSHLKREGYIKGEKIKED